LEQAHQSVIAEKAAVCEARKGLEGRGAFPKGMERSGTPESPVSGAGAGNAPKFLIKPVINEPAPKLMDWG
jgi:hypothetical protein